MVAAAVGETRVKGSVLRGVAKRAPVWSNATRAEDRTAAVAARVVDLRPLDR